MLPWRIPITNLLTLTLTILTPTPIFLLLHKQSAIIVHPQWEANVQQTTNKFKDIILYDLLHQQADSCQWPDTIHTDEYILPVNTTHMYGPYLWPICTGLIYGPYIRVHFLTSAHTAHMYGYQTMRPCIRAVYMGDRYALPVYTGCIYG